MVQAVLLDIDGTLIDNNALHVLAWQRAFRRAGIHLDIPTILHHLGMGSDKFAAATLGPRADEMAKTVQDWHSEEYSSRGLIDHTEPLPGARDLLKALKERGVRTALASSAKPEEAAKSLDQLGGRDAVDALISSGDAAATKPDPDIFATALERLGGPKEALIIGDTVYDIAAAHTLHLPCVCVLSGGIERSILEEAGAAAIYADAADVLDHLDAFLALLPHA